MSAPITKGEGFSALMRGYWATREKLGPMPIWHHVAGDRNNPIIRPMERKPESKKVGK